MLQVGAGRHRGGCRIYVMASVGFPGHSRHRATWRCGWGWDALPGFAAAAGHRPVDPAASPPHRGQERWGKPWQTPGRVGWGQSLAVPSGCLETGRDLLGPRGGRLYRSLSLQPGQRNGVAKSRGLKRAFQSKREVDLHLTGGLVFLPK